MQVSILMVRALAGAVERAGGSREQFFVAAGLDPRLIADGSARLSAGAYQRSMDAAIALSGQAHLRRRRAVRGVERSRINAAKRMLEDPRTSIQEVADAMGFAAPAAFHRAFKRWTGMTPAQYRASF